MTVSYAGITPTAGYFGNFFRLLFLWSGSVWKLLLANAILYFATYATLSYIYRCCLDDYQKGIFEFMCVVSFHHQAKVRSTVTFAMGFFVSLTVDRWWDQFMIMPWPDSTSVSIAGHMPGMDYRTRLLRKTLLRYLNVSYILYLRRISAVLRNRYKDIRRLTFEGYLTNYELKEMEKLHLNQKDRPLYLVPIVWFGQVVSVAREEGHCTSDAGFDHITECAANHITQSHKGIMYDWFQLPLVYIQIVQFTMTIYFTFNLFSQQYLDPAKNFEHQHHMKDWYIPFYLIFEFFFFWGWFKVAQTLVNPYGFDCDDFEMEWLVKRNNVISHYLADVMNNFIPVLVRDIYWNHHVPDPLFAQKKRRKSTMGDYVREDLPSQWAAMDPDFITDYNMERAEVLLQEKKADMKAQHKKGQKMPEEEIKDFNKELEDMRKKWEKFLGETTVEEQKEFETLFINPNKGDPQEAEEESSEEEVDNAEHKSPRTYTQHARGFCSQFCQYICPRLSTPKNRTKFTYDTTTELNDETLEGILGGSSPFKN